MIRKQRWSPSSPNGNHVVVTDEWKFKYNFTKGKWTLSNSMAETVLKIFIIIMFLVMEEIPYILKIIGLAVIGTVVIIDWYTYKNEK